MKKELFEQLIDNQLANIRGQYIDLNAGDIHYTIGGFPSNNHRMPTCCSVMRSRMLPGDKVLFAPPKGNGSSLTIRYFKR